VRAIIDRIEGEFAVLEAEGMTFDVPVSLLPGAREGAQVTLTVEAPSPPPPSEPDVGDSPMNIQL
jgi:hypothetical protein